ncbi:MAG: hypothetical protein JNL92_03265 [Opitutaceae bacterium]|nr:hypothetical protein [Opitutaceae bacterium]
MKSPQAFLLLLLAGTTVGGAILAWRQYGELVELRGSALNRAERADLQKRIWDLEKQNRELQDNLAAARGPGAGADPLAATTDEERPGRERGGRGGDRGGPGGRGDAFQKQAAAIRDLMSKPEVQALLSQQQKAAIEGRYAALFRNLNLAPDQAAKLTALLAERGTTMQDVMSAAREQGIDPRENPAAVRKLIADAQNQINASIKSVIGDQGFAQLTNYEQTMPQRQLVNDLQQRLSYTSTPLTAPQAEQLVQILATNAPPRPANPSGNVMVGPTERTMVFRSAGPMGPPPDGFGGRGGPDMGGVINAVAGPSAGLLMGALDGARVGGAPVTGAAVAQAQGVLSPPQVAALQQIQQQQQAQQQLRDMVNETMKANQPPPPPDGTAPSGRKRGG